MKSFLSQLVTRIGGVENEAQLLIRIIVSLAVFILMLLFRKQIAKGVSTLLCRIAFAKSTKAQKAITSSIYRPLSCFVAVVGAYIGTEILFSHNSVHSTATVVLKLCFICLAAWFGINMINSDYSVVNADDLSNSRKTAIKFINNLLKIVIAAIAALLVLEQFGISASKLFAALGIGGVAVAFACKDMVENMISGFIIIFDKPFEVGDFIELNGDKGTVTDIKIRTTRLTGVDGCEKVYPNTAMANSSITNWSKMHKRAVSETIAITYSTDAQNVNKICDGIRGVLLENESVLADDVRVGFSEFGTHALEISVFFYVDKVATPEYMALKNDINVALKSYFDSQNVSLAFESKTLYFAEALKIEK